MPLQFGKRRSGYFRRYREIITLMLKYGFEDVAAHSRFASLARWRKLLPTRDGKPVSEFTRYERMRMVTEELGPTFIKFAQILSNRPDLLPKDLIKELEKLQDKVPPFPADEVKGVIEKELNAPVEELFFRFDDEPIASASLSQVHKAQLHSGEIVALKIQRPGIKKKIASDVDIMTDLARVVEKNFEDLAVLRPTTLVATFEKAIHKEMNFLMEASNIQQFGYNFRNDDTIYVPQVYFGYTTARVLCMEFVDGVKITDIDTLRQRGVDLKKIAQQGNDLYYKQIFEHGIFHADPHPGNIFVMPDHRLCLLDFGMMGHIMPDDQILLGDLLYHIYNKDIRKIARTIQKIALNADVEEDRIFEYDLKEFLEDYFFIAIEDIEIGKVIERVRILLLEYRIEIPANFHLLLRALVIIEGVGKFLDPQFRLVQEMKPYARRILARRLSPTHIGRELAGALQEMSSFVTDLPADLKVLMDKAKKGNIHIEFEHKGLGDFYKTLDVVSNRISFAIVIAALLVGSSLIVVANIPPYFEQVPIIGIAGFVIAAILAVILLANIILKRRL